MDQDMVQEITWFSKRFVWLAVNHSPWILLYEFWFQIRFQLCVFLLISNSNIPLIKTKKMDSAFYIKFNHFPKLIIYSNFIKSSQYVDYEKMPIWAILRDTVRTQNTVRCILASQIWSEWWRMNFRNNELWRMTYFLLNLNWVPFRHFCSLTILSSFIIQGWTNQPCPDRIY